jgi:class 3 adenylate cyclase/TolB-like protein
MPDLPTGTITFLFTDIEGSTLLWQQHRRQMPDALARHERLLRDAIETYGGYVFKTVGDQFCAVFSRAPDAVATALDAQRALHDEAWEIPGGIRVRMILHSGIAQERDRDYFGTTLNRTARMLAAGHGGQILLSQAAWELVWDELPPGIQGRDLGEHKLKDLPRPERLFQLVAPGLPADFPSPRTQRRPALQSWLASLRRGEPRAVAILVAAGLVAGLAIVFLQGGPTGEDAGGGKSGAAPTVAVLPFTVRGDELGVWREGMVDLLSTNLSGVPGLRAVDSRTVLARWHENVPDSGTPDLRTSLDVAGRTGARYALIGNVLRFPSGVRFTADVYDVQRRESVGARQVEGPADSIPSLVDQLSIEVLILLQGRDSVTVSTGDVTTRSLPALKEYLQGQKWLRRSAFKQAIPAYQRAVDLDSTFALAYYRLATAGGWTEIDESNLDRRYMERAARFAGRLTKKDALLVQAKLALWRGNLDGLEPLRQAVQQYPDDPEVWYLLGETSFHLGRQALASQAENDSAFARAVELDPGFAPAYIHLIENAFNYHADSARAARLVETYAKVTDNAESAQLSRLALSLAFGDGASHASARARLDSLAGTALLGVALHLWHPRFGADQEAVLEAVRQRGGREETDAAILLFVNRLLRGKLQTALASLDDPGLEAGYRAAGFYIPFMARLPGVPSERRDAALALGETDTVPYIRTFYAGAYAAGDERWTEHATAVERLQAAAGGMRSRGDPVASRFTRGMATALEGYALMKKGREEEALHTLMDAQRETTATGKLEVVNATIRFWLSELLRHQGDFRAARTYAASFWQDPLAAFSLAQIDEQLEDYAAAREAYSFFVESWKEADPDLQPLVEEGRRASSRLSESKRRS